MKSYGQLCSVAKALDVLGDRWTLLILRELLIQGPCRYTDLANGLAGIASNLLSERLRNLEASGLVWREAAPPPVATTLFHLTERGRAAEPVLVALARWGTPLIADAAPDDAIRAHWVLFSASAFLRDRYPGGLPITVQLHTPLGSSVIEISPDGASTRAGTADNPDITLEGMPQLILRLLAGELAVAEAAEQGLVLSGDPAILDAFHLALA
ncbi:MAG: winged helix-turn-helix transcriptional regulator [Acidimicrobiales bacterium]